MKTTKTTLREATKSCIRILLIFATFTVGALGLMFLSYDNDPRWYEKLILSKIIAVAGWYGAWRLYERWRKTDKWLAAYDKSCDGAMKNPNPLYIGKEDEQK